MRLREVFRYECDYRLRSPATWMYAAFLFIIVAWGLNATASGGDAVNANAPQKIAQSIVMFGGLFGVLVSAALFGNAAIRDAAAGMDPLLYTTRLRKTEYLGGRFLATLTVNAIAVLAIPLGFWFATVTLVEADALGPNRLAAYVQPLLLFVAPNLVLIGAIQFTIGALARQVIPVYLGTAAVFVGYIVAANYWNDITSPLLSALADPLGINALLAMSRYWTPSELKTRLIGFPPLLVLNRVIWLAIAAAILAVLHRNFRFAHVAEAEGRRGPGRWRGRMRSRAIVADAPPKKRWQGTVPRVSGVFGRGTRVWQTLAVARQSLAEVMSGRGFQVGFIAAIGLVLLWGWNVGDTLFETSTWPVTHLVLEEVLSRRAAPIPWLLIALYSGELVWKYREVGSTEIVDAAPAPIAIALLGRFLALVAIIIVFHAGFMAGGILLQTLHGYYNFELGLYIRILFGLNLVDDVLLAAIAMTIHVIVNQKYVGHILVLLVSAFKLAGPMMGLHKMWVYNAAPDWTYSDMNGFGPFLAPFLWFKAYWASWAMLLAAIVILFWVQGPEPGVRHRLAQMRTRLRGPASRIAGVAIALILMIGGFVFYNTNVLNEYRRPARTGLPRAEYERRYRRFEHTPQPVITNANLRVEIYPDEPAIDIRGSYHLINRTDTTIDSLHIVVARDVDTRSIALDRAAIPETVDDEAGYRIFRLAQPLQPGDAMRLSFDVSVRHRGFPNSDIPTDVVRNGSYFNRMVLPFAGYQPAFELSDARRERFGLAPRPPMPSPDDAEATRHDGDLRNEDRVQFEMIVGTAADQTAIVSAPLRRSWSERGRRYFRYGTDTPGVFGASVFSARYAVVEDKWRDIGLQILHHPNHATNPPRMIQSMKASLDYYTSMFGPYQFGELRIVEIPPYSINGRAHATTIAFAEQAFITRVKEGGVDMTFFGTAHEVAHSWWGGQLRTAYARGRAALSESLANYSAMMVTEKILGPNEARRVYDYQMDRYLSRRSAFDRDVPLTAVEDHPHIAYGKGAVAMYTLREQIGDAAVNTALRRLIEKHRDSGPPYATSLDLVRELRAVTPDSLQYLITDLFETVTLWDVKTTQARAQRTSDGHYDVILDLVATKLRADSAGRETETPMDDFVEIGVFAPNDPAAPAASAGVGDGPGATLYLQRHRIRSGKQTIRITVSREPARAGIDPARKLIDRTRDDNVVDVKVAE